MGKEIKIDTCGRWRGSEQEMDWESQVKANEIIRQNN
jgi:hypothetical protein